MKITLRGLALAAASLCLCAGAGAQSRNDSVNCLNDMSVNASGTSAARGSAPASRHAKSAAAWRSQHLARDRGTLPVAFPQCANKSDRGARADCVASAWEARQERLASASGRRPC